MILHIINLGSSPNISNISSRSSIGWAELWRCLGYKFESYLGQAISTNIYIFLYVTKPREKPVFLYIFSLCPLGSGQGVRSKLFNTSFNVLTRTYLTSTTMYIDCDNNIILMGMLELVVRSRLGRGGINRTSSSLVTHKMYVR